MSRLTQEDLIEQYESRRDGISFDTPNNPLSGWDPGEWPSAHDEPEVDYSPAPRERRRALLDELIRKHRTEKP